MPLALTLHVLFLGFPVSLWYNPQPSCYLGAKHLQKEVFMYLGVKKGQMQKDLVCQEDLQVSNLSVGDLDMSQALGFGWEKAQEFERKGQAADEFLGLGCLAVT